MLNPGKTSALFATDAADLGALVAIFLSFLAKAGVLAGKVLGFILTVLDGVAFLDLMGVAFALGLGLDEGPDWVTAGPLTVVLGTVGLVVVVAESVSGLVGLGASAGAKINKKRE